MPNENKDLDTKMSCVPVNNPNIEPSVEFSPRLTEKSVQHLGEKKLEKLVLPKRPDSQKGYESLSNFFAGILEAHDGPLRIIKEYDGQILYLDPKGIFSLDLLLPETRKERATMFLAQMRTFTKPEGFKKSSAEVKEESQPELERLIFEYDNTVKYLEGEQLKHWLDIINSHIVFGAVHHGGMKSGLEVIKWKEVEKKAVQKIKDALSRIFGSRRTIAYLAVMR